MSEETIIEQAEFNPRVTHYWLLSGTIICIVCIVTIPILPIWLVLGMVFTKKYLDNMSCVLTNRSLKVRRGLLVKQEKTVPLDKITDLGMVQGPIMRAMELHTLSVETAGSGGAGGALVRLTGICDAPAFRDRVLEARDAFNDAKRKDAGGHTPGAPAEAGAPGGGAVLEEIRDLLREINAKVK